MKKVAVTGGLACGKSLACRLFQDLGAHVVSTDDIVHQLLSRDTSISQRVIALLGQEIVVNGNIDRTKIAEIVFKKPTLLKELEQIVHPLVIEKIHEEYQRLQETRNPPQLFIAEVPLLFEIGAEIFFDTTIAVNTDEATCRVRFASKNCDPLEYDRRASRQLSHQEKAQRADYVIDNNGTVEQTKQEINQIFHHLIGV